MTSLHNFVKSSLIALLAATALCHADPVTEPTFDIATAPLFSEYRPVLIDFLQKKKHKSRQDFCIVGYLHADQSKSAWVIWKQPGKMILWEPGDDALNQSRRILDLKHDVVKTEKEINGSTYLVTRAWVKQVRDDCERAGVKATLSAADFTSQKSK